MSEKVKPAEQSVEDVMHRGVVSCKAAVPVKEVVRTTSDTGVQAVVIVDDNGLLAGIVSQMDLIRLYGHNLLDCKAGDVMTRHVISISPTATLGEAVALMLQHNVRRVVVVEKTPAGDRPIGVLSTADVIREMREQPWFW